MGKLINLVAISFFGMFIVTAVPFEKGNKRHHGGGTGASQDCDAKGHGRLNRHEN